MTDTDIPRTAPLTAENPLDAFYDAMEQIEIHAEAVTDQAENAGDIDEDQDIIAEIRGNLRQMALFHKAAQAAGKAMIQRIKETA
jgi:Mg2+ and Co2+ transporter CorA